jgi:Na+-driven multidrug efflux pump
MPFFMGPENAERFGLLVGSLFAAVANKYIVDSILPETTYYTLVDKIHVITFIYILIGLILTVLAYRLDVAEHRKLARRIDWVSFWTVLISFASINVYLIRQAL